MKPPAEPKAGDVIAERFQLVDRLGEGGMGVVWRATQLNLGRDLALKLLHPEQAASPAARARFSREARVASQLKHPHAVQIYDFGETDDGVLFIAMELLRGITLRDIVDIDLPLPPLERSLPILGQVADVLIAAHELSLTHRDLKPENIFLERGTDGDRAVVVDFGLAFIADRPDVGRMTQEGIATGTPDYMSPEQAAGDDVGPASDVYGLGVILYELLTGKPPYTGSAMQVITQHLFAHPQPPREVRRDLAIPRQLEDLCLWMLSKRPEERPAIDVVHGILSRFDSAPEARERGRDHTYLEGRAARMISAAPQSPPERQTADIYALATDVNPASVAVVGTLQGDLVVALGANGILPYIVSEDQTVAGADAIYAPGAGADTLAALSAHGVPVLSDTPPGDMERVTRLLRAGADEVITQPVHAGELARRVWRAVRRHRRRSGGTTK